jgi:hypothetical protein
MRIRRTVNVLLCYTIASAHPLKSNQNQTKITFDLNHLHRLIIAGGLKPMLRKQHELSYPQFENYLIHSSKLHK